MKPQERYSFYDNVGQNEVNAFKQNKSQKNISHLRKIRIRWHSFTQSNQLSSCSRKYLTMSMSAFQMHVIKRKAIAEISSLFEEVLPAQCRNFRSNSWVNSSWVVSKFVLGRRFSEQIIENLSNSKGIFGVSLLEMSRKTGLPLPDAILEAMQYLRKQAPYSVGIFRKPGVKSRIEKLKAMLNNTESLPNFDGAERLYDVADTFKQYIRELPEPILTRRYSGLFVHIMTDFTSVETQLYAFQIAVLLLPDENRIALLLILSFLKDIALHSSKHHMTIPNLSTCFAPTLFAFERSGNTILGNFAPRKFSCPPDHKEVSEQKTAVNCLTFLIENVKHLYVVPRTLINKCGFKTVHWGRSCTIQELKKRFSDTSDACPNYVNWCIAELIKESQRKMKGWMSCNSAYNGITLSYKKVNDGCPLRLWKTTVELEAPPEVVLHRVLRERELWDDHYHSGKTEQKFGDVTEIFTYRQINLAPQPPRQFYEFRSWRKNVEDNSFAVIISSVSPGNKISQSDTDWIEAVTLASRYLIQPVGCGRTKLLHLSRVDLKGYSPEWYNKIYGYIVSHQLDNLRLSFKHDCVGPETKV